MRSKVILVVAILVSGEVTFALSLYNGDFSDGLSGWINSNNEFRDGGGYAVYDDGEWHMGELSQQFTLPAEAVILSFDLYIDWVPGEYGGDDEDIFTAWLLDPQTQRSLLYPSVTYSEDENMKLGGGIIRVTSSQGHGSIVHDPGRGPFGTITVDTVSLDVSSWAGQDVQLTFWSYGCPDYRDTTFSLDNVCVYVPEPMTILLLSFGAVVLRRRG